MTSFTELLNRTKPLPEPEVPAEAEAPAAASWGLGGPQKDGGHHESLEQVDGMFFLTTFPSRFRRWDGFLRWDGDGLKIPAILCMSHGCDVNFSFSEIWVQTSVMYTRRYKAERIQMYMSYIFVKIRYVSIYVCVFPNGAWKIAIVLESLDDV